MLADVEGPAADWCILVPDDVDDDEAATAYINPLTALLMVRGWPRSQETRSESAAASAIGRILIRMIASTRAHAVAIVRSQSAAESLRCEPAEVWSDTPMPRLNGAMDAVGGRADAIWRPRSCRAARCCIMG
jgi:NADPH:quinone reductase-like Zn-dependent oxidoreductase